MEDTCFVLGEVPNDDDDSVAPSGTEPSYGSAGRKKNPGFSNPLQLT